MKQNHQGSGRDIEKGAYVAVVWLLATFATLPMLKGFFSETIINNSNPRWKCFQSMGNQFFFFPVLFGIAWHLNDDMASWSKRSQRGTCDPATWAFKYIFAMYLCLDFLLYTPSPLILVHHAICLIGHAFSMLFSRGSFPSYFASVVALELGSGSSNIWFAFPDRTWADVVFLFGMAFSNVMGLQMAWHWYQATAVPIAVKSVCAITVAILVAIRTWESFRLVQSA